MTKMIMTNQPPKPKSRPLCWRPTERRHVRTMTKKKESPSRKKEKEKEELTRNLCRCRRRNAPNFTKAVKDGSITDIEYSEWTMIQGIRAAASGLPFIPTRAGGDSDVVGALGFKQVVDPYTGVSFLAVPPIHPEDGPSDLAAAGPDKACQRDEHAAARADLPQPVQ